MKTFLKVVWISLLSTVVKLLTQVLVDDNFLAFLKLDNPRLEVFHYNYLFINIVVFVVLTIVFIYVKKYIPAHKLFKGVIYSMSITLVWFALKFEPTIDVDFIGYFRKILIFFIPMLIYGIFLGYLSSERSYRYQPTDAFLSAFIYFFAWVILRIIYLLIDVNKADLFVFSGAVWLIMSGAAIGVVFGLLFDMSKLSFKKTVFWIFLMAVIIFFGYYLSEYTIDKILNPYRFLAAFLDIAAIMLATLINFIVFKDSKKLTTI